MYSLLCFEKRFHCNSVSTMNNKKYQPFCLTTLLIIPATFCLATSVFADEDRGQSLYENHCQECHDTFVHKRDNRRVNSTETLGAWVWSMSAHTGLAWGEDEVHDITQYLNQHFYRFSE